MLEILGLGWRFGHKLKETLKWSCWNRNPIDLSVQQIVLLELQRSKFSKVIFK